MPISKLPGTLRVPAVLLVLLGAGARRLRAWPAARPGRSAASAAGDGRQARQAAGRRPRRVCRPLRRGRRHRDARARVRLSRCHPFQGRPAGEEGRPSVHHRPPALRGLRSRRPRPTSPRPAPTSRSPKTDLARGQGLVRGSTITQQTFDQRTQAKRVAEARGGAEAAVRQAALDLEFTELRAPVSGRIGDRRVSPGQPGHGRHDGHHDATRHHHIDRPDPLRVHHG